MLTSLYIKNLAIIDELTISFSTGLNIITGETGAGKTLIIKAIQLLMGRKFSPEILRTGCDILIVEGNFTTGNNNTIIRRTYSAKKQSKSFINNEPVTNKELLKTTHRLADLHGQHDHQNLLDANNHLSYLDSYGNYNSELILVKRLYQNLSKCENKLQKLLTKQDQLKEKSELYEFQLKELTEYPLSREFELNQTKKYNKLLKTSEIQSSLSTVIALLEGQDSAVINCLNKITNELESVSVYDDNILTIQKRIVSNRIDMEDLLLDIQKTRDSLIINQDELEIVDNIIFHIEMLKRKYGGTIDSVIEYRDSIIQTDIVSEQYKVEISLLVNEVNQLKSELLKCSKTISKYRNNTGSKLEKKIKNNLSHLNMAGTNLKIQLYSDPNNIIESGMDTCEFFISTNIGEKLLPVVKIASGGEISRIMLAIKMALQSNDFVDTLIFDEIDSGISGATAERVGETFEKLANSHQILCITHLSQIAGKGESHYKVSKNMKGDRIVVNINRLSNNDRIGEIATLISGKKVTESSRKQAKELLYTDG